MARSHSNNRIAVIIPVYAARFLAEALESVFFQTHQPDEVIVVDDGSPDRADLGRALAPYSGRVRLIEQENQGAAAARNAGLTSTSAEFVALLDADDRWMPDFLHQQLAAFTRSPHLDLVFSDGLIVGKTPLAGQRFMEGCPSTGPVTLERLLAQQCTVLLSSVVARRDAINRTGGFDVMLRRGHDFDLWLRMAHRGAFLTYQRQVLTLRRMHDHNLSGTRIDAVERPLAVLDKTLATLELSPRQRQIAEARARRLRSALEREQGKQFLEAGDFAAARRAFARARPGLSGWKIVAALLGLHLAPQLVRRIYLTRSVASLAS